MFPWNGIMIRFYRQILQTARIQIFRAKIYNENNKDQD